MLLYGTLEGPPRDWNKLKPPSNDEDEFDNGCKNDPKCIGPCTCGQYLSPYGEND